MATQTELRSQPVALKATEIHMSNTNLTHVCHQTQILGRILGLAFNLGQPCAAKLTFDDQSSINLSFAKERAIA